MSLLTKYGTVMGEVPASLGDMYFVAPTASGNLVAGQTFSASDDQDGLSPERPLLTIAQAILRAKANAGDIIALLPGTHTSAVNVALSKAGLSFVGVQPAFRGKQGSRNYALGAKVNWTSTYAGAAITNTAPDCTFTGINFVPVTAQSMMTLSGASRNAFVDCSLTMSAAASTSTKGFVASGTNAFLNFYNCVFLNSVATSAQGPCLDLTGASLFNVEGCKVLLNGTSSAWAVAVQLGAGSSGFFNSNLLTTMGVGTMTIGIDGTGVAVANAVLLDGNRYGVSPGAGAVKNLTNADGGIINNYYATIGGGAAGVLQTVTA